jgi:hypothetical protein
LEEKKGCDRFAKTGGIFSEAIHRGSFGKAKAPLVEKGRISLTIAAEGALLYFKASLAAALSIEKGGCLYTGGT